MLEVSFHVPDEPVPRSFSSFRGRVILVGFWTAGCTMCDQQLAILSRLHDKYSSAGLVCVGLYDLGQTFTMAGVTILQGAIESSQAAELPKERPAVLVLDREGRLVEKYSQLVEDEDLEKLVQPLLGV
ncbi:MAG: redoxin domain-containing protein [Acidobacteria bacterium]|nr:redoxin domain-containing protein [Acidobacteriota bacterium]